MRRWITYLHQPDYVYSTTAGAVSPPPLLSGQYQIYLDVWERVITYAEDDSIREVALGGPDTAARTKLVWQVKWVQAPDGPATGGACATFQSLYGQLQPANRGWLQAMAKQGSASTDPCIINPNASYTGPENQLYRVEINRGTALIRLITRRQPSNGRVKMERRSIPLPAAAEPPPLWWTLLVATTVSG